MTPLSLLLAVAGLLAVGTTTDVHHRRLTRVPLTPLRRRWVRRAGWALLTLSLPVSLAARGPVYGLIWWLALVMLAAGLVFLGLNFTSSKSMNKREKL